MIVNHTLPTTDAIFKTTQMEQNGPKSKKGEILIKHFDTSITHIHAIILRKNRQKANIKATQCLLIS